MFTVRYGNTAPVFVKTHDQTCIPECPARHERVTGYLPVLDGDGEPVLDDNGEPLTEPVVELVHDGTRERVVVLLAPGETYRVTHSDVNVQDDDDDKALWLDRAFLSIASDNGAWRDVSDAPPGWVECPGWPELEMRLAAWFGCPIGAPAPAETPEEPS